MNSRFPKACAILIGVTGFLATSLPMSSALAAGRYPAVFIKGNERSVRKPLRISRISAETEIAGNIASTTLTMVFDNPVDLILEGELVFPIAPGQTISRFSMDVNGKLREGVYVEKFRGRDIFESLVRWRIDPGLLEWIDGEHFRARVFPIPRKGTKTILVRYEQELKPTADDAKRLSYTLPLAFPWPVEKFEAEVRSVGEEVPFQIPTGFPALAWEAGGGGFRARLDRRDYQPNKPLIVEVPAPKGPFAFVSEVKEGERYFYLNHQQDERPPRLRDLTDTSRVGILWDVSSSSLRRRFDLEFELLDRYFKERGDVEVSLVPFHNVVQPVQNFSVLGGDWSALRFRMESFFLDGGTRYGALDLEQIGCDEYLLFSDGKGTFGDRDMRLGEDAPVFPVASAREATAVHLYLHHVAVQTGGRVIDLNGRGVDGAFQELREMPYRFLGTANAALKEVYPPIADIAGTGSITGVVPADADQIELKFGYGKEVTDTITLPLSGALHETDLAERLWVRKKLAALMGRQWQERQAIIDLGRDHGIVTPYTSLIVLDRVQDYVNFRVEPPANEPELVADWRRMSTAHPDGDGLPQARGRYADRQIWYQQKHAWLDETNLFLAQNGARFLGEQIGLNPNDADLAADLRKILPLYGEAQKMKAAYAALPAERESEAYRNWMTRAIDLQNRIEPLRIKYVDRYLDDQARKRESEANRRRFLERLEQRRSRRFFGGGDFFAAADPFAASFSSGGGGTRFFDSGAGSGRSAPAATPAPGGDPGSAGLSSPFEAPPWTPLSDYTIRLQGATSDSDLEGRYRVQKRAELANPLFYVDAADLFFSRGMTAQGIRVLSNVAELRLGDVQLMRMVAYRLQTNGQHQLAMEILEEVFDFNEDDPQSWRDLALACIETGQTQRGADLLWEVVSRTWPEDQGHVADIALNDLANLAGNPPEGVNIDTGEYEKHLLRLMPVDLRVVMTWDAAQTDIDLFLYDPSNAIPRPGGEEITLTGCRLTGDNTMGFGPEEVLVHQALPGKYSIRAKLQDRNSERKNSPVTVYVEITKNFGRPNAETKRFWRRITSDEGRIEIASYHHVIDAVAPAKPGE